MTDDTAEFSSEEKTRLKAAFVELTKDTPATPLAVNGVKAAIKRTGPSIGSGLLEILKSIGTSEVKKHLGLS